MVYKWCVVTQCTNTSIKTPEKMFVSIPKNTKIRNKWLMLARRNPKDISEKTNAFMCEDHFNIEQDMANYTQYKMGFSQTILMVRGVMPSKFHWLVDRRRRMSDTTVSRKARRKRLKTDIDQESQPAADTPGSTTLKDDNAMPENAAEIIALSTQYMANMKPIQHMVIKLETVDIEYDDKTLEQFPIQCQDGQMATVKAELDKVSPRQLEDGVTIKEEIEIGPTEFLPQCHTSEVPQCKVEPGTSESTVMSLMFNESCDDVTMEKQAEESATWSSRYVEMSSATKSKECNKSVYKCVDDELERHMLYTHNEKLFTCEFCPYKCKKKCKLDMHMRTHTGENPFACNLCSYKCKQLDVLGRHIRTHSGEKPFACELCSYKYKHRCSLLKHNKRCHKNVTTTTQPINV